MAAACGLHQAALRIAVISSALVMVERPEIFSPRACCNRSTLVCSSSDCPVLRGAPCLAETARLAESLRSWDLALADFLLPEPPFFSPPPDCLFTVAHARASASPLETPFDS